MAERDKSSMDAEVQAALKGYKIRWQTRQGAPYSAADLAKVSASAASTVILMRPDNSHVPFKDSDSAAVRRQRLHQVTGRTPSMFFHTVSACFIALAPQHSTAQHHVAAIKPPVIVQCSRSTCMSSCLFAPHIVAEKQPVLTQLWFETKL